ncbi:MerR family transcriptional regulator [Streptomyces gulbargensis]|uniref:MerR family transcriptional regulator n=2 Tax=Streptomyces gulbargensis TaxID=364901 RepID=A0ABP7LLV0_9ACTN
MERYEHGAADEARPARMMTIGEFSRASRLSAKVLRRYDELGLLRPARVDPYTAYRYYTEDQLERARLVGWLRRLGMPPDRTREVCDRYVTDPDAAARAVRAHWARAEAETAARRSLAASLTDLLEGPRTMTTHPYALTAAAHTDPGLTRPAQQDAAVAGPRLLAVADGYGPAGAQAARTAVGALAGPLPERTGDLLNALEDAVTRAGADIAAHGGDSGTTLIAAAWTGSRLAVAHVGDSRAYRLRDGALLALTRDHTVVQDMIDAGELTPAEAAAHPDRPLLLRALDGTTPAAPDLTVHEARPGDRYLLCTDGLSAVVPTDDIRRALAHGTPDETVHELTALAHARGGPDNLACVVADVTPASPDGEPQPFPRRLP